MSEYLKSEVHKSIKADEERWEGVAQALKRARSDLHAAGTNLDGTAIEQTHRLYAKRLLTQLIESAENGSIGLPEAPVKLPFKKIDAAPVAESRIKTRVINKKVDSMPEGKVFEFYIVAEHGLAIEIPVYRIRNKAGKWINQESESRQVRRFFENPMWYVECFAPMDSRLFFAPDGILGGQDEDLVIMIRVGRISYKITGGCTEVKRISGVEEFAVNVLGIQIDRVIERLNTKDVHLMVNISSKNTLTTTS